MRASGTRAGARARVSVCAVLRRPVPVRRLGAASRCGLTAPRCSEACARGPGLLARHSLEKAHSAQRKAQASGLRHVGRAEPERPEWPLRLGRVEGRSAAFPHGRTTRARRARGSAGKPDRRAGTGRPVNDRRAATRCLPHSTPACRVQNNQSDPGRTPAPAAAPSLCVLGEPPHFSKAGASGRRLRKLGDRMAWPTVHLRCKSAGITGAGGSYFLPVFSFSLLQAQAGSLPPPRRRHVGPEEPVAARGFYPAVSKSPAFSCCFQSPQGGGGAEMVESQSHGALVQCVNQPKVPG